MDLDAMLALVPFVREVGVSLDADTPDEVVGSFMVVVVEVRDDEDRLVAQVTRTQAVLAG